VRKNAAYNLPCFFYYFGNYEGTDTDLDINELYIEFSQDESPDIKMILARGIHEAIQLIDKANKNPFGLVECFSNLLKPSEKNIEISLVLADHIGDCICPFIK
jgi:hypothetical protein